jgi:hypothetical protein
MKKHTDQAGNQKSAYIMAKVVLKREGSAICQPAVRGRLCLRVFVFGKFE